MNEHQLPCMPLAIVYVGGSKFVPRSRRNPSIRWLVLVCMLSK